ICLEPGDGRRDPGGLHLPSHASGLTDMECHVRGCVTGHPLLILGITLDLSQEPHILLSGYKQTGDGEGEREEHPFIHGNCGK
ncbi:hypothetical protein DV515_00004580, partial [Chloebia gouldiae]